MNNAGSMQDVQQQLAEERTETAHRRTRLAEERTYSAWVRTGLASLATGFAVAKLLADADPAWLIRTLGVLFIVVGGVMFGLGFLAYQRALRQLHGKADGGIPVWVMGTLTFALVCGALIGLAFVFLD